VFKRCLLGLSSFLASFVSLSSYFFVFNNSMLVKIKKKKN
jgi:hypothetical protein